MREIDRFTHFLWENLGHCSKCMRTAFRAAAIAWICVATVYLFASTLFSAILAVIAVCLTVVWLAHIVAFGIKSPGSAGLRQRRSQGIVSSRRTFVYSVVRAMGTAVVFTSFPAISGSANCDCKVCDAVAGFVGACCAGTRTKDCNCKFRKGVPCEVCCR